MKPAAYYNEHDPFAAAWLRELIKEGLITDGEVDERSIEDVLPSDLKGFNRVHFFAGIGGWDEALRLADWPTDRAVWTGSCPCQPFSTAGKGGGFDDERHLWPAWFHLIEQCRPDTIFGEQVEAAIKHGWLDLVQDDLESLGYAVGAVGLPAASVGAFHIRQRLWFVADVQGQRCGKRGDISERPEKRIANGGANGFMADPDCVRFDEQREGAKIATQEGLQPRSKCAWELSRGVEGLGIAACGMADSNQQQRDGRWDIGQGRRRKSANRSGMVDTFEPGLERLAGDGNNRNESGRIDENEVRPITEAGEFMWHLCRDGKYRPIPVESALFPLVNEISNRVGILRGAGNAIVPQVAAEVIRALI